MRMALEFCGIPQGCQRRESLINIVKLSICRSFIPKHEVRPFLKSAHGEDASRNRRQDCLVLDPDSPLSWRVTSCRTRPSTRKSCVESSIVPLEHCPKRSSIRQSNDVGDVAVKALLNPNDFHKKDAAHYGSRCHRGHGSRRGTQVRWFMILRESLFDRVLGVTLTVSLLLMHSTAMSSEQRSRTKKNIGTTTWRSQGNKLGTSS